MRTLDRIFIPVCMAILSIIGLLVMCIFILHGTIILSIMIHQYIVVPLCSVICSTPTGCKDVNIIVEELFLTYKYYYTIEGYPVLPHIRLFFSGFLYNYFMIAVIPALLIVDAIVIICQNIITISLVIGTTILLTVGIFMYSYTYEKLENIHNQKRTKIE